jgi:hypothetical protein
MTTFVIKGPFEVPVRKEKVGRIVTTEQANEFWTLHTSMQNDVGCYVFGFKAAKGLKPMYIGKATKSFKQEIFTDNKRNKYNEALAKQAKGRPVIFFVTLEKTAGRINKTAIDEAESFLIQTGLVANKNLLNDKKTAVEKWSIKGVIRSGQGQSTKAAQAFKQCLGL